MSSGAALQEPVRVTIPRYVLRGQGKDEHFEYEVKVSGRSQLSLLVSVCLSYLCLTLCLFSDLSDGRDMDRVPTVQSLQGNAL